MRNLFLLFCTLVFAIQCQGQVNEIKIAGGISLSIRRLPDTVYNDNSKIEYVNEWAHMTRDNQHGSFPNGDNSRLIFAEWKGNGIDIYTEAVQGHKYYVVKLDGKSDTVFINTALDTLNHLTYSKRNLDYARHVLEIDAPKYGFVFNYALVHHDNVFPDTIKLPPDTVRLPPDTVRLPAPPADTVFVTLPPVVLPADTVIKILEPNIIIRADSLYFKLKN